MIEPMRYAVAFAFLGASFALLAVQSAGDALGWVLAVAEGYCAISVGTLAIVYALQDRGAAVEAALAHPRWGRFLDVLLLPYRCMATTVVSVVSRFDSMDLMHPVGTRLYVGRLPRASDRSRLASAGVTSVLNLCVEFPDHRRRVDAGLETVYFPVLDGAAPSHGQFRAALDWIARRHAEGHTVLIHCAQGRGRSVTVAAAALCHLGLAAGPDDALAAIVAARPKARPSRQQRRALVRFASSVSRAGECLSPAPGNSLS